jgi:hypothetical protein
MAPPVIDAAVSRPIEREGEIDLLDVLWGGAGGAAAAGDIAPLMPRVPSPIPRAAWGRRCGLRGSWSSPAEIDSLTARSATSSIGGKGLPPRV